MSLRILCQRYKKPVNTLVRNLNLHEHHGKRILQDAGVLVHKFGVARSPEEALKIAQSLPPKGYVVKAQVLAGGRGKGTFSNGFQGGVQSAKTPEQAMEMARKMLGQRLITKQTTKKGQLCEEVMIAEKVGICHEYYFSIVLDRTTNGPVLIGSSKGGVNIEEVAESDPSAVVKIPIDINTGVTNALANEMAEKMGFKASQDGQKEQAANTIKNLYKLFIETDCNLLEINPLIEDTNGNVICLDCKINLDSNAGYRQEKLFALKDTTQEDELEARASNADLNYIRLDGNIGCLVNGAGLAMATMDIIKLNGGEPANFLDVGGGATVEQITEAFRIITADKSKVNAILVNIFGGIMKCDIIAEGIIKATSELALKIPIVVRLQGTRVDDAKALIKKANMQIYECDSLAQAAELVVKLS